MNKEELQMLGFEIVAYSGDARSTLLKLLKEVRQGNFEHVDSALKEADENLTLAHNSQTKILAEEASGKRDGDGIHFYPWTGSFNDHFVAEGSDSRLYCTVQAESRIGEERYGWNH